MANYTVDSMIEIGRDGQSVTFRDLYTAMKNFLLRKPTAQELEWFNANILKDIKDEFYEEKKREDLIVGDLYVDTSFFEGPLETLDENYTEDEGRKRTVPAGTYVFSLGS